MSASETALRTPVRLNARVPGVRPLGRKVLLAGPLVALSFLVPFLFDPEYRRLVVPVLFMVNIAALFVATLWDRDRQIPIFEAGSLWMAATLVYSAFPFLGFIAMELQWQPLGDARLLVYEFDLSQIAGFAWRYVVYMASFALVYLKVRGKATVGNVPLRPLSPQVPSALIIVLILQYGFMWVMKITYGVNFNVTYGDTSNAPMAAVPYGLWQITVIVFLSIFLVKQALLLVLITRWRNLTWRMVLISWISIEVLVVTFRMGARSIAVLLLVSLTMLYHRFVRPIRPIWAGLGGALLLSAFLVLGIMRGGAVTKEEFSIRSVFTTNNEFQVLFATAYDIHQRKLAGTLGDVPWQIYVTDLYLTIPSQLLPFEKWDPSEWYLGVLGARGTGVGFMFGVMAQAVLGFDWVELVFRGVILGLFFGFLHRWYVRNASSFWVTLLYLFITIWSYYTFRATTFWFTHFVVYQFLPVMLAVKLFQYGLSRGAVRDRVVRAGTRR